MARISSYPKDSTIQDKDCWIGTESSNRLTRNFTAEDVANYVVASTSGVTGSGTLNTIPLWTPDGTKLGDSIITFTTGPDEITVSGRLNVTGDLLASSRAIFEGDYARFSGQIQDGANNPGTAGQVLTSTGTGVAWDDASDVVSGAVAILIPYLTTATPGGSETYTALNNIVKIGWSGGNGIYVINLPSATTIPYRNIRFTTNGTYPGGGAHKVRFTATGGETIDGAAYYEISKEYEGISVWSTGTEWVVIQAKAH